MVDLGLECRNFLFEGLRIVTDHRIYDDRVDERHSDDPAGEKEESEVDLRQCSIDPVLAINCDGIGDLVPAFNGEKSENRVE